MKLFCYFVHNKDSFDGQGIISKTVLPKYQYALGAVSALMLLDEQHEVHLEKEKLPIGAGRGRSNMKYQ